MPAKWKVRIAGLALGLLLMASAPAARTSEILFVCNDRDVAIELAELANDYYVHILEVGRVTMAERHGFGELHRQVWERAERARASGDCAFVPAFDHRRVALLFKGPEILAAKGLARRVYEIAAADSGRTFYVIGMGEATDQP